MITALAHVCVFSTDLERTQAFYTGILGLKPRFRFMKDGALFGYYLEAAPNQFIEVFRRDRAAEAPHPHIGHICLETDDIQALHRHLEAHGVPIRVTPKLGADHSWQMWIADPDGTAIEFHQYTPESTQYTGADCIVNW
jgi:catechol 2,3-dioxygenase-like lactoylglutathione lyase family enzyme